MLLCDIGCVPCSAHALIAHVPSTRVNQLVIKHHNFAAMKRHPFATQALAIRGNDKVIVSRFVLAQREMEKRRSPLV